MLSITSKPATCGVHRPYKAFYLKKYDTKDNATKFLFKSNNNDSFQDNIIHIVLLSPYPLFFFSIRIEKYLLVVPVNSAEMSKEIIIQQEKSWEVVDPSAHVHSTLLYYLVGLK